MVIAPAKIGKDNNNNQAVINTAQTNKGNFSKPKLILLMLIVVVIKFNAPNKEEIPAKCKANIDKSTAGPLLYGISLKGGYRVHPLPAPPENRPNTNNPKLGGYSQKLMLFNLGIAISGLPINIGNNQLPKPPIKPGITR